MLFQDFMDLYPTLLKREMTLIADPRIEERMKRVEEETDHYGWGTNGIGLHRGTLCPDPFVEMDSNAIRGRFTTKAIPKGCRFQYAFDKDGRLLCAMTTDVTHDTEVIIRDGSMIWGVKFTKKTFAEGEEPTIIDGRHIYGTFIHKNKIQACYLSSSSFLKEKKLMVDFSLIDYREGVPNTYTSGMFFSYLGEDGSVEKIGMTSLWIDELFANDEGDIIAHRRRRYSDEIDPSIHTRVLVKPIKRKQWDRKDLFGLF